MYRYFIIHKPFNVLSQFTNEKDKLCLKDFCSVPSNVYPVGRLDYDSEGLLLLTNDKSLNKKILHPSNHYKKEYWVQVEGIADELKINELQKGVIISVDGNKYNTLPCIVTLLNDEEIASITVRNPPIRERKNIPTTWISITLTEGKNRQVRKMTAAVGLPTLRLIRNAIGNINLQGLSCGKTIELPQKTIYTKLNLRPQ